MSNKFKSKFIAMSLLATAAFSGTISAAADVAKRGALLTNSDGFRYQIVQFADLNLATEKGSAVLYRRLHAAAIRVCSQTPDPFRLTRFEERSCSRKTLNRAIDTLGNRGVAEIHQSRSAVAAGG